MTGDTCAPGEHVLQPSANQREVTGMRLRSIEAWSLETSFTTGPYITSHVTQTAVATRVLRITAEDGTMGIGEIVRGTGFDNASVFIKPAAPVGSLSVGRSDKGHGDRRRCRHPHRWALERPHRHGRRPASCARRAPELLISGCDLTEPLAFPGSWRAVAIRPGSRIAPIEGAGHGVTVPDEADFEMP